MTRENICLTRQIKRKKKRKYTLFKHHWGCKDNIYTKLKVERESESDLIRNSIHTMNLAQDPGYLFVDLQGHIKSFLPSNRQPLSLGKGWGGGEE